MKVSIIILPIFCLILISCEVTPPGMSTGKSEDALIKLRNAKVECQGLEECEIESELIGRYFDIPCSDVDFQSLSIAEARSLYVCHQENCITPLKNFIDKENSEVVVSEGAYTLFVFMDLNQNENIDKGEPCFFLF